MTQKRVRYKEGDVFLVPLLAGGFGIGVVARKGYRGVTLGYFFGSNLGIRPENVPALDPEQAVLISRFGDLGLLRGQWVIAGKVPEWRPEEWPLPRFVGSGVGDNCTLFTYDEEDLVSIVSMESAPASEAIHYYLDSLLGYKALEVVLTRRLDSM